MLSLRKHMYICKDLFSFFGFINIFRSNIICKDKCNVILRKYSTGQREKLFIYSLKTYSDFINFFFGKAV